MVAVSVPRGDKSGFIHFNFPLHKARSDDSRVVESVERLMFCAEISKVTAAPFVTLLCTETAIVSPIKVETLRRPTFDYGTHLSNGCNKRVVGKFQM